jgi:hypothetical protein
MTAIRFSGEGRAHNPGLAIESMRVVERIAEQARSGALFLIPNRPREVVQHAPRPPRHRTGGFPPRSPLVSASPEQSPVPASADELWEKTLALLREDGKSYALTWLDRMQAWR